jgi:hypothetical protein
MTCFANDDMLHYAERADVFIVCHKEEKRFQSAIPLVIPPFCSHAGSVRDDEVCN